MFRQQFSVGTPFPAEAMEQRALYQSHAAATAAAAASSVTNPEDAKFFGEGNYAIFVYFIYRMQAINWAVQKGRKLVQN